MIVWVLYDIQEDKSRNLVSKICKRAGLNRVQYSVFLGTLSLSEVDSVSLQIEEIINEELDSVYIFPMSKKELQETKLLGQAFDKKIVSDQVKALFF
ncbi:MAG: CRISPR-associated endonuclease Cas2 [Bacteroidia bacterium]|nr:CRISPR-associated endonuclease Cas2 [Bacteroidia bacterium]